MGQIFPRSANLIAKATIVVALVGLIALIAVGFVVFQTPKLTNAGKAPDQPVPFLHSVHVASLGIDCRYCHTGVETSSYAGIPPTSTCMNCHSQVLADNPTLAPVRDSFATGKPLVWAKVYNLPKFVYFDHSIHVAKGVGCETCHGRVDQMGLMQQVQPLQMTWCLQCHRNPAQYVRPKDAVTVMGWQPPADRNALGQQLVKDYHISSKTSCSTCHR